MNLGQWSHYLGYSAAWASNYRRTKGEEALINKIKELLNSGRTSTKENDNKVT